MPQQLIECVPNFSEGRDAAVVEAIAEAIGSTPGVMVLARHSDPDHNRSVVTMAGAPEAVLEAAVRAVGHAAERIDLNRNRGVHPRIGAADVVPFVPLEGATLADCAVLARRAGAEIWRRFRVPVYFYGAAAAQPERVRLEDIRRGQFERLREAAPLQPERAPDIGGPGLHPTAGATAVGARRFLIAYNINLATSEVTVAQEIARKIRQSSGGLPGVKAMGVLLASRNLAQVSMNLTDFERTPLHRVYEAIRAEAARLGVRLAGDEVVGLIPRKALASAPADFLRHSSVRPELVLEDRIEALQSG